MDYKQLPINQDKVYAKLNEFKLAELFKNVSVKHRLYISGSTVLNIIKNKKDSSSDLDLYFQPYGLSDEEFRLFLITIAHSGYRIKKLKKNNDKSKVISVSSCHETTIRNLFNQYKNATKRSTTANEYAYFSLKEVISCIMRLYNPTINREVDIIIMRPATTIEDLIVNSFDYDIIKNFISMNEDEFELFVQNENVASSTAAKMHLSHFENRVMDNFHEFNNFIVRYVKYKQRGYSIYIGNFELSVEKFKHLIDILLMHMDIRPSYSSDISAISFNKLTEDLTKLFIVSFKKDKEEHTYHLRPYIDENVCNKRFKSGDIGLKIIQTFISFMIKKLIRTTDNDLSKDIQCLLRKKTRIYSGKECSVCLEEKVKLFNVFCGNDHSFCGSCTKKLCKKGLCPLCRGKMFQ